MSIEKQAIIIAGPTASGKTALAIAVAKHFNTEIISADSRQCYKEMNIGVARPSPEELAEVPHHFIATHSIHEKVTAATFEKYALQKTEEIFRSRDTVILAGGTGLYLKAFCEGLDEIPEVPETIRAAITKDHESNGLAWLQEQVQLEDPAYFAAGETSNPHRLMRALEVVRATGRSILTFRKGQPAQRPFTIKKYVLSVSRPELYERINHRVDRMMQNGLLEEVKGLYPYRHLPALQTVGYTELFAFLDGKENLDNSVEAIKKNTRHYAKRQGTWFRKDEQYVWVDVDNDAIGRIIAGT